MSSVVVCGNGPSLADVDLRMLGGVITLGMNAAYRYWERIDWYPDIYCCLDDRVVVSHQTEILGLIHDRKCRIFFLHQDILAAYPGLAAYPNVFFLPSFDIQYANTAPLRRTLGLPALDPRMFWSSQPMKVTTGAYSVRFAAALGFTRLLLLGIDARYVEVVQGARAEGKIGLAMDQTPDRNPNYFFADYQRKGDKYNLPTPPNHDGNLHSDVFHYIRDDFASLVPDTELFVGSAKSELYKQKLFPLMTINEFLAGAGRDEALLEPANLLGRQAPWIAGARPGAPSLAGWYMQNNVRRTGLTTLEWPAGAGPTDVVRVIAGERWPLEAGRGVALEATLTADADCSFSASAGRFGSGPYEEVRRPVTLKQGRPEQVRIEITLKARQEAVQFGFSPLAAPGGRPVRLSLEHMTFSPVPPA